MRVPTRRDASRSKRRAQVEEHLAILQLIRARLKRKYAETTIEVIERADSTWRRLRSEKGSLSSELNRLMREVKRFWKDPNGR